MVLYIKSSYTVTYMVTHITYVGFHHHFKIGEEGVRHFVLTTRILTSQFPAINLFSVRRLLQKFQISIRHSLLKISVAFY